ncbi:hypothetical protein EKO04_006467 [Ascochyta lentis]|uniref:Uncharacterized protein n=1 Tax=Ascochyta lentis TaxID=205686 RepID=A0A8H7J592_9PLEO|nr:hypothetical protein EKO04_006467 [Ascochyta lentis]
MPVTIRPSLEKAGVNTDAAVKFSEDLLRKCEQMKYPSAGFAKCVPYKVPFSPIMHCSFKDIEQGAAPRLIPYANGFIEGVDRAYQQDLHLVLRPEDVWQAVITQFCFYVNGYAKELRQKVVAHEGKKKLELHAGPSPDSIDVAIMTKKLICLIEEHLVDQEIRN